MTRSLSSAISGIDAAQAMLDNIGNNIANVNTTGYQDTSVQFSDLLYQQVSAAGAPQAGSTGGVNPIFVGTGVRVSGSAVSFAQGTNVQTGSPTDVAIQGNGFLIANQNGQTYYTRAGNLKLDGNGQLVTQTGALVQGWSPNASGVISTTGPTGPLSIPQGQAANPQATANITMGGNLPVWNGTGGTAPSLTATTTAYDSLGNQIPITITFTGTSGTANSWDVAVTTPTPGSTTGATTTLESGGTITFSPTTGQMTSTTPLTLKNFPNGYSLPSGYTMNLNFPTAGTPAAVTQFSGSSTIAVSSQDGYSSGSLQNFTIGSDGTISGTYSNGRTQSLGQVALAIFSNPQGLTKVGNLDYQTTLNSGTPQVGTAGTGGRGQLLGGSLESSNVDLGTELTNLIVAQNAYQADTKVVSTSSTVLQALVQMA
ncbi:MAG: flagellar hook protein FlgE [Actinomycetota bacterium]|nr:flagellar hook protein FlgE [Actinomycetota bacterium]